MASSSKPLDLEITVVSAKHLKNVNWRNGDLKPYATFYIDPDHRLSTHSDDSGSTRPVWNQCFTLPITRHLPDSVLTLEIFHSRPSEIFKPLVGTLRFPIRNLVDSDDSLKIHTVELRRPSGRPQGKVRLKLAIRERPLPRPAVQDYHTTPQQSHYYSSAPPPPTRFYSEYTHSPYSLPHQCPGYYSGYYSSSPSLPSRPFLDRGSNDSVPSGPSAPLDYSSSKDAKPPHQPQLSNHHDPSCPSAPVDLSVFDHGVSTSATVGSLGTVTGTMGRLSLEDERRAVTNVGSTYAARYS